MSSTEQPSSSKSPHSQGWVPPRGADSYDRSGAGYTLLRAQNPPEGANAATDPNNKLAQDAIIKPDDESNGAEDLEQRIRALEKENRILKKKLKRSESDRIYLERNYEVRESMLNQVVHELEIAQAEKEQQNQDLNQALQQLRAMQGKLLEAEKMSALGILVAGVAHEINNPISFIHGNVECANAYLTDLVSLIQLYQHHYPHPHVDIINKQQDMDFEFLSDDVFDLLKSMKVGSDRIREIVLSLRTFSRHDESEFKEADIHQGIDSTLLILQHRLKANGRDAAIVVQKDYGNLPSIPCFAGQLNQVFMNILANAIDALRDSCHWLTTPDSATDDQGNPQPTIWIKTQIRPDENIVSIKLGNNGPPIPATVREHLFEPFFTTKGVGKGTGLGLSISYQIVVDRHNGQLTCVSSPNMGSEFLIEIPCQLICSLGPEDLAKQ